MHVRVCAYNWVIIKYHVRNWKFLLRNVQWNRITIRIFIINDLSELSSEIKYTKSFLISRAHPFIISLKKISFYHPPLSSTYSLKINRAALSQFPKLVRFEQPAKRSFHLDVEISGTMDNWSKSTAGGNVKYLSQVFERASG